MTPTDLIKEYWGILMFLAGLVFHSIWVYIRVGDHGDRLKTLESRADSSDKTHAEYGNMFAEINAKLDILLEGYKSKRKK